MKRTWIMLPLLATFGLLLGGCAAQLSQEDQAKLDAALKAADSAAASAQSAEAAAKRAADSANSSASSADQAEAAAEAPEAGPFSMLSAGAGTARTALRLDMLAVGDGSCYVLRSGGSTVVFDAGSASDLDIVLYLPGGVFVGLGGFLMNVGGDPVRRIGH